MVLGGEVGVATAGRGERCLCERGVEGHSWLNLVERFFGKLTDKALRRGVFTSVPELITAIDSYLQHTNQNPQPFTWTATADQILEKVRRGRVTLDAITNKTETVH